MSETLPLDPTEERWRRLEELFHAALDLRPESRDAFIDLETAGDLELRAEALAMLQHASHAGDRIAGAVQRVARRVATGSDWIGRRIGPYRIVREIGRGGMGLVFEALRDDAEYDKTVALKVAPDWRDLEQLRERFRHERQILARLEHPNIARFLDGGTDHGIPYFAMEFIDGKPITAWMREHNLGVRERIMLFRKVCSAVHYAHENLVVHRDLKPANILVDRTNTPKLLDFGIAALLSPILEEVAATTGIRLWTPDYTSPEQVRGGPVTVRTDVYSLGLVLYEILCGERAQVADPTTPLALDRSICEIEPGKPSVRAAARGDRSLSRQLEGDLDTIVAMTIRKEPERRYGSAAALDADLERYLDGRPVKARPNTTLYRFSKLIRRHKWGALAVSLLAVSVVAGVGATLYEARRAQRRFEQVRSLANSFVFEVHDQIRNLPGSTEARKAIAATALRYLETLSQEAGNDASLRKELAAAYERIGDAQGNPNLANLGDSKGALDSYRRAASLVEPLIRGKDAAAHFASVSALYKVGILQRAMGDSAAVDVLQRARVLARQVVGERPTDLETLGLAGNINAELARIGADTHVPQLAKDAAEESTAIAARMVKINPNGQEGLDFLALSRTSLGAAKRAAGDPEGAVQEHRAALEIRQRLVQEHPESSTLRRLLLIAYGHVGDALGPAQAGGLHQLPESIAAYRHAAEIAEWLSNNDPADRKSRFDLAVANSRTAGAMLADPRTAPDSVPFIRKAQTYIAQLVKEDPANQRYRIYALIFDAQAGKALAAAGNDSEASLYLQRVRAHVKEFLGGANEMTARSFGAGSTLRLAEIRLKTETGTALSLADQAAIELTKAPPRVFGTPWGEAVLCGQLGSLYLHLKKPATAHVWLERSAAVWRSLRIPASLETQRKKALAAVEQDLALH